MEHLWRFSDRPFAFLGRYIWMRPVAHVTVAAAVLGAVGCSIGAQYGVKFLVDTLSAGARESSNVWLAFILLATLIAADNLLWRLASWVAASAFVAVTGDLRRDLFRHLTGHAPSYFTERLPGTLTARITAVSNAAYTIENVFTWNVLPPCAATIGAVAFVATVSVPMALGLGAVAGLAVAWMFRRAAAGGPLHHEFADKSAAIDGEMIDVINNLPLVKAFCGLGRELHRFEETLAHEMAARRRSLLHLEKLRLLHAAITVVLAIGLLAWAVALWQRGAASTGEVILVSTLGLSVLHATRDLAVALVDVTQHVARLSEALSILLVPHALRDHPEAAPLVGHGASVTFERVSFTYPDGRRVFEGLDLRLQPDQRIGLVGESGSGKSTLFALLQRYYDVQGGRILIGGQDIARVTQESLRQAIAVVPQDVSLFHRSVMENIRYGRPDASDREVLEAAAAARCGDFIDALPDGIATIVGDRGVKLSGGQRQRIAIARAFLKDAPILLLDEATSALDSQSEEAIREALIRLMRRRTVIAIAHRLSTLRSFDRIVVLQRGRVIQDGAPDELAARPGPYRDLLKREGNWLKHEAA
jgi:ATP-binding cassette subfamily B protein